MKPNALAIANYFVDKAKTDGQDITLLSLVKLVYIAHGFLLALFDRSFIDPRFDKVEAWRYGPVIPSVYHLFCHNKRSSITEKEGVMRWSDNEEPQYEEPSVTDQGEIKVLNLVWQKYGKMPASQLVNILHKEGSPWWQTYEDGKNKPIPDELTKQHYSEVINLIINKVQERSYGRQ